MHRLKASAKSGEREYFMFGFISNVIQCESVSPDLPLLNVYSFPFPANGMTVLDDFSLLTPENLRLHRFFQRACHGSSQTQKKSSVNLEVPSSGAEASSKKRLDDFFLNLPKGGGKNRISL